MALDLGSEMAKTEQHRQAHCCLMNEREFWGRGKGDRLFEFDWSSGSG